MTSDKDRLNKGFTTDNEESLNIEDLVNSNNNENDNSNTEASSNSFSNADNQTDFKAQNKGASSKILISIPNSSSILALGISSIVSLCCCGPIIGSILAIIALAMFPRANREYQQNREIYNESSLKNLNAGKITAIIGLVLGLIFLLLLIIMFTTSDSIQEVYEELWNATNY